MIILKPKYKKDLDYFKKIESILETNDLRTLISKMNETNIEVKMPKMKIESEIKLGKNLKLLGINKLFSTDANFDGLTTEPGVFVSDILHKALIEITEEGTVGAAVTVGIISKSISQLGFELNSPALLIIRDNEIGVNLYKKNLIFYYTNFKSIGINNKFDTSTDFGRLSSKQGIVVGNIYHEAVIEVPEARTVAAAASSTVIFLKIVPKASFVLNKPIVLIIRDMKFDINLFFAKILSYKAKNFRILKKKINKKKIQKKRKKFEQSKYQKPFNELHPKSNISV
ncbi:Serpin-Z7 [Armadillidium nasatum]|uniref:Serpin-Z7 n=1 Tax=Armadillidium nasatum TaxID=96803 RepID=A0A5N5TI74_9CRUS|nr:Serpin-Z7 [Armadillidium nasatum]